VRQFGDFKMSHVLKLLMVFVALAVTSSGVALAASGCSGFRNPQRNYPVNRAEPLTLQAALPRAQAMGTVSYVPLGQTMSWTLEQYLDRYCVTGLLVLHRGAVVYERYLQGFQPNDALISASMSKSILALLVGIAVGDGKLSMEETVKEVLPNFAESAFAQATVEDLLRMTSGVALKVSYERGVASDNQATSPIISPYRDIQQYLRDKRETDPAGKVFHYNGAVSAMLGAVLQARTHQTHTEFLQERLWQPMGAEGPAFWVKNNRGEEGVQGMFAATLRDYARLGLLVMMNGKAADKQVVPESWIKQMTTLRLDKPQPSGQPKYGLHIWIPQAAGGRSMFLGTNGQAIFIDPVAQTVIVHTANSPQAFYDGNSHLYPLRDAIVKSLKSQ
jgi:CubicO group peptidase (beta-lactamase class C family)